MKMQKFTAERLDAMFAANGITDTEAWVIDMCMGARDIILADPTRYRAYGQYWWLIKTEMIRQGILDFGDFVDAEIFAQLDYGYPHYNVMAAFQHEEKAFSQGSAYNPVHSYFDEEEGELHEYFISDSDVEIQVFK